jgi:hypothetical protein
VPGHGELDAGTHRITERCLLLVGHAERLATRLEPVVVIFSGWSSTGGPSEAEQMRDAWRGPAVELAIEPTATSTAENASRTLPLVLDRDVGTAHVVCAPLHAARTRFFFGRLYAGAGVHVHLSIARVRPSLSALGWELAALTVAPAQLRRARAELERSLT